MTRVHEAIDQAARRLSNAGIPEARTEARLLLTLASGITREEIAADADRTLDPDVSMRFESFVTRRVGHEPFAYIAGEREFWSMPFLVTPATLIPRPDTETVVEAALEYVRAGANATPRILDLGTGTGCILLALMSEIPNATGLGVDASAAAVAVAEENARALGYAGRTLFRLGHWADGVTGPFDLIVSNPPYIPDGDIAALAGDIACFEPRSALAGGRDGLDAYRALAVATPPLLAADGALILEVGMGQADAVAALLQNVGLSVVGIRADLAGIARCVVATLPGNQENPGFGR